MSVGHRLFVAIIAVMQHLHQVGSVGGGGLEGILVFIDRGERLEYRILSLHVSRKVGGLWRGDRAGVGGAPLL